VWDICALENIFSPYFLKRSRCRSSADITPQRISAERGGRAAAKLLILNGRRLDMYIETVEERAGDLCNIPPDHRRRAETLARLVIKVAPKGTGSLTAASMKRSREAERHRGVGDGDSVVLQRLSHCTETREAHRKKKTAVCKRDFAGTRNDAAADESGI
jgi:hypothetical protein